MKKQDLLDLGRVTLYVIGTLFCVFLWGLHLGRSGCF